MPFEDVLSVCFHFPQNTLVINQTNRTSIEVNGLRDVLVNTAKHIVGSTKAALNAIERETGVRYTILLELPYFDPARMCIIDPMHNLFLGTAKKNDRAMEGM